MEKSSSISKSDNDKPVFRPMQLHDIGQVQEIEIESFPVPWTEEAFRNELQNNHFARYIVMELDGIVVGYGGMWIVMDEAHITNIALRSKYRGRKLGELLLHGLQLTAIQFGAVRMTLEVRVSNHVARNLYSKFGFHPAGLRKGYYSDNLEDAIIMWADLVEQNSQED